MKSRVYARSIIVLPIASGASCGRPSYVQQSLPIDKLVVRANYQREPIPAKLARMYQQFNPDKVKPLAVNARDDDTYSVLDGQHRYLTVKRVGWSELPCYVYHVPPEEEPLYLVILNEDETPLGVGDKMNARIDGGDQNAILLSTIVSSYRTQDGLPYLLHSKKIGKHIINCVGAFTYAFEGSSLRPGGPHPEAVHRLMKVVSGPWQGFEDAKKYGMVRGLHSFFQAYLPFIDFDRLTQRLSKVSPATVDSNQSEWVTEKVRRGYRTIAREIVRQYNWKLRESNQIDPYIIIRSLEVEDKELRQNGRQPRPTQ